MKTREEVKDEAYAWAADYIEASEEIEFQGVFEGMRPEEWDAHLEFITDCFEAGLKPTHFVDLLIASQTEFNEFFDD